MTSSATLLPANAKPALSSAPSLWWHLWGWALGTTTTVWLVLAAVAFYTGHHEAEEIAEGQLQSVASHWLALPPAQWPDENTTSPRNAATLTESKASYTSEWALLLWQGPTLRLDSHGLQDRLPAVLRPGLQQMELPGLPGRWRAWVQDAPSGEPKRRAMVLVPYNAHAALGRDIAEHVVRPALVLLPLVALMLAWALQRGLRPLRRLGAQVAALDLHSGAPLPAERRYAELEGTVLAINTLVQNLQDQVRRERGFAADVAHELRTPLTALVWQARLAQNSTLTGERADALQQVERAALRAGRILSQLLDLARAQGLNPQGMVPVPLGELAARVLADHAQTAFEGGRELGLQDDAPGLACQGHPLMLELALRNLVDNALRHTPSGAQVLVRIWRESGFFGLDVLDDAGGSAAEGAPANHSNDLGSGQGSGQSSGLGIGLTLVRRIAAEHGAELLFAPLMPPYVHGYRVRWAQVER